MSGFGNYGGGGSGGGSGGWDLNAFGDWETMYNTLGGSGSSTPGTQGSATPGGYQPPSFDVDAYARASGPRPPQGLSQIREGYPCEPTQGGGGGSSRAASEAAEEEEEEEEEEQEEDPEDRGRHPYNNEETKAIYTAWLTVSYDPIVGNQQAARCFWEKVRDVYHQIKPKGARKRKYTMLRSHFKRVDVHVKKFCSIYSNEAAQYQSGASGADILRAALRVFHQDTGTQYKYVDIWQLVKDEERWAGGVRSSSGSTSKRTKHTATGNYSQSGDTGEASEGTPQVFGGTGYPTPDEYGGSGRGRRRPQGTKAAKAARARKGRGESSQSASGSGSRGGSDTLMVAYITATMADTSRFSYAQFTAWWNGIVAMAAQLNLPPPPKPRPPPEDDSPAE